MMGLTPLPDMELYWSNDPFYNNSEISRIMPVKRFKKITENLPMIMELNNVFQQETVYSSTQSIDECMVKFKGRSSLKQYMLKKSIKCGFKVWARCDSKTGYLYQFEVYTGKGANMEDEGLGYNVVSKLCADLPEDTLLAFDIFLQAAICWMTYFFSVGTVRTNRKDLPDILMKSQPKHLKLEKNKFAAITAKPITAIKWLDTRDVTVLTTAHHPTDAIFVKRTQKDGINK
ncbi:hypothetical protein K1T71_004101 [Dendrolimus kikuchii]|uniref:Uncharacterized protein n=1 Tax=Dendrolimus kikuchii TaxID=765133 RepID=A0ACC1DBA8_9NEOP|nr:hypothetical protein K1T71_004101 [Dendrolimus kikuchii]